MFTPQGRTDGRTFDRFYKSSRERRLKSMYKQQLDDTDRQSDHVFVWVWSQFHAVDDLSDWIVGVPGHKRRRNDAPLFADAVLSMFCRQQRCRLLRL